MMNTEELKATARQMLDAAKLGCFSEEKRSGEIKSAYASACRNFRDGNYERVIQLCEIYSAR